MWSSKKRSPKMDDPDNKKETENVEKDVVEKESNKERSESKKTEKKAKKEEIKLKKKKEAIIAKEEKKQRKEAKERSRTSSDKKDIEKDEETAEANENSDYSEVVADSLSKMSLSDLSKYKDDEVVPPSTDDYMSKLRLKYANSNVSSISRDDRTNGSRMRAAAYSLERMKQQPYLITDGTIITRNNIEMVTEHLIKENSDLKDKRAEVTRVILKYLDSSQREKMVWQARDRLLAVM